MKKRYRAFISYSQHDKGVAKRLHRWLEAYRAPVGIAAELDASRRLGRFYRDEEDMPATSDIGEAVRKAIDESENLIVICSPRAAQSKWVDAEIRYFRETHGSRNIFAFIVQGVPNSGDPATECFPPAFLSGASTDQKGPMPAEPLGLNLRTEGWQRASARLVAGLLGVGFDNLWQRSRRRLVRQRTLIAGSALAFAIIVTSLVTIAIGNRSDAAARRAELLASEAAAASESGDHLKALRLAVAGHRVTSHSGIGGVGRAPDSPQVTAALEHAYTHNLALRIFKDFELLGPVALSKDGERIAIVDGTTVNVLRASDRRLVFMFKGFNTRVTSVDFSPDGKLLAVADIGSVSIRRLDGTSEPPWRTTFGTVDSLTKVNGNPTTVQFSPRGDYLMTFADQDVALWRVGNDMQLFRTFRAPGNVNRAVMDRNARLAFFRLSGGEAIFWEVEPQVTKNAVAGKTTAMGIAALSNNVDVLTSDGPVVSVWKPNSDAPLTSIDTRAGAVTVLAFTPDSEYFATGSADGAVQLWLPGRSEPIARFVGHTSRISSIVFSNSGERMLTGSTDGTVTLWRTNTSEPVGVLDSEGVRVLSVAFSADGKKALTGAFAGSARVWSTTDGKLLATVRIPAVDKGIPDLTGLPEEMQNITLAEALEIGQLQMPNPRFSGKFAELLKTLPGTMTLRQLVDLAKRLPMERSEPPPVAVVAFAPDGRTILTGSWDETARIWPVEGGTALQTIPVRGGLFTSASFSADGRTLLTTSTSTGSQAIAHLRNLKGEELVTFTGHEKSLRSSAISPDGKWIVTGSQDKTARLWRIEGGNAVQVFKGQRDAIIGVDFSPDSKHLLTASQDGTVWLWEIGRPSSVQVWRVSERDVKSVTFLRSGGLFVTSSGDGAAKVWRIGASTPVQTFHHRASLFQADVSPDGRMVLTGGGDGYGKLWAVDDITFSSVAEKTRLACERLRAIGATQFTSADRQRYGMLQGEPNDPCM